MRNITRKYSSAILIVRSIDIQFTSSSSSDICFSALHDWKSTLFISQIQRHSTNLPSESPKIIFLTISLSIRRFDNVLQYSVSSRRLLLLVKMIIIFADRAMLPDYRLNLKAVSYFSIARNGEKWIIDIKMMETDKVAVCQMCEQ